MQDAGLRAPFPFRGGKARNEPVKTRRVEPALRQWAVTWGGGAVSWSWVSGWSPHRARDTPGSCGRHLALCAPFSVNGWDVVGVDWARRFAGWILQSNITNYGQGRRGRKELGLQLGFFYNSETLKISQKGHKYSSCELQWYCLMHFTDCSCCLFQVEMLIFHLEAVFLLISGCTRCLFPRPSLFLPQTTWITGVRAK